MTHKAMPALMLVMAAFMALLTLGSGELLFQMLGAILVVVGLGTVISQIQLNQSFERPLPNEELIDISQVPPKGLGEKLYPYVFLGSTIVIVLVLTLYVAWDLGLW